MSRKRDSNDIECDVELGCYVDVDYVYPVDTVGIHQQMTIIFDTHRQGMYQRYGALCTYYHIYSLIHYIVL